MPRKTEIDPSKKRLTVRRAKTATKKRTKVEKEAGKEMDIELNIEEPIEIAEVTVIDGDGKGNGDGSDVLTNLEETSLEEIELNEPSESIKQDVKGSMNAKLMEQEAKNRLAIAKNGNEFDYLYPNLDDPSFNVKIATRKEFYDTRYDGKVTDVEEESNRICFAEFELAPHQAFVRNFMSFQTPYNSLLLYHGLGSGKTCSAISVAEEMRDYLKQIGITQRIIIVASPNVQQNFRLQLFNENKLELVDGFWNIRSCVGSKLLKEINPMNTRGLPREKVISQIKRIISNAYLFLGYLEFANYITKTSQLNEDDPARQNPVKAAAKEKAILKRVFDNRLIIIDEVHDIRMSGDRKDKRVSNALVKLVMSADNLRLLLLSATPMYNSYKEIVWLLNLMRLNDRRSVLSTKDVFDEDGEFRVDKKGYEIGRELLERSATGYVSFVRGENPYMFPFKVWPSMFDKSSSIKSLSYPKYQMNQREIVREIEHLDIFITELGEVQNAGYSYIVEHMTTREKPRGDEESTDIDKALNINNFESFGYTVLQKPIEALNIVYPSEKLDKYANGEDVTIEPKQLIGKEGLRRIMKYQERDAQTSGMRFEYKNDKYGRIFARDQIGKYSGKINNILDAIIGSTGIVMVYSQYLDGGLVPVALALEEAGFTRYGNMKSLFAKPPTKPIDSTTYKPRDNTSDSSFTPATYIMITGNKLLSPNNVEELQAVTKPENADGKLIKVILISPAGGQGLDFTNIRQVHIMEPWYNMNRAEQTIGRAVRSCSHKSLPFAKRNVQIYLHGTKLADPEEEAADLYVYKIAETKAIQIGRVNRVLKEIAIDCLLNTEQQNFTAKNMNQEVDIELSTGGTVKYVVGDKPFSYTCDYMDSCEYKCKPVSSIDEKDVTMDTYNQSFIEMNNERILQRIRQLFKEKHIYDKDELISSINIIREYPLVQINSALQQLVTDASELVADKYGRMGRIVNIERLYMYQPVELTSSHQSSYARRAPIEFKREAIVFDSQALAKKAKKKEVLAEREGESVLEVAAVTSEKRDLADEKVGSTSGMELIRNMSDNYNTAFSVNVISRRETDWYKFCSLVLVRMREQGIEENVLRRLVVAHIVDSLVYNDFLVLLNYLENVNEKQLSPFEELVKEYVDTMMLQNDGIKGIMWQKNGIRILVVLDNGVWGEAQEEDKRDLASQIQSLVIPANKINTVVGFMTMFKDDYVVFKVKQLDRKRHKGARCDQAGKADAIKTMNMIVGEEEYTSENTSNILQKEICVMQEFTLRIFDMERKDGKRWFFSPGQAALIDIEKMYI